MSFRTQYERVEVLTCPGDPIVTTYKAHVEDDGSITLKTSGKVSIYDEIQSHADSVNIELLLKRFQQTGDDSMLMVRQAYYGDFTEMPKTVAEMYQRMADAKDIFAKLPTDVKAEFNNDPQQFLASFGTEKFFKVFDIKPTQPVQDELKEGDLNGQKPE